MIPKVLERWRDTETSWDSSKQKKETGQSVIRSNFDILDSQASEIPEKSLQSRNAPRTKAKVEVRVAELRFRAAVFNFAFIFDSRCYKLKTWVKLQTLVSENSWRLQRQRRDSLMKLIFISSFDAKKKSLNEVICGNYWHAQLEIYYFFDPVLIFDLRCSRNFAFPWICSTQKLIVES